MELEVITKVDEHQLMELYLNSLLDNTTTLQEEIVAGIDQNKVDVLQTTVDPVRTTANVKIKTLLFRIGNMTVATPMSGIFRILLAQDYLDRMTWVPASSVHSHGLITVQGKSFEVIDVAHLMMPKDQEQSFNLTIQNSRYLLLITETAHAILCQDIMDFKDISLENIRQAKNRYNYSWHIGTLMPNMIPMLDLATLAKAILAKKC